MLKFVSLLAAPAILACSATPALAQEAEEPRTTYRVTMIDLADGADERWAEMHETMVVPARAAAGLAPETVHWIMMNPEYDLMVVSEVPRGMSSFDTHANPERAAFVAQLVQIAGGEDELEALGEELDGLIEDTMVFHSHTHP